jgi:hypothetical protein
MTGEAAERRRVDCFFVFDPDGLRIEVFSPGTEWSSRIHGYG